jgi:hypothetical protein
VLWVLAIMGFFFVGAGVFVLLRAIGGNGGDGRRGGRAGEGGIWGLR